MKSISQAPRILVVFAVFLGLCLDRFGTRGFRSGQRRENIRPNQHRRFPDLSIIPKPTHPLPAGDSRQQRTSAAPSSVSPSRGFFSGIGGMVFMGFLGALPFRGLGIVGNPDWGQEGFPFGDLFLLAIVLGLIFFIFKHVRKRPAMSLNAGGSQSFSEPGMAYSSFSALEGSSVPTFRAPSLAALQHIRDTDPAFSESDFLSFAKETFNQIQQGWGKRDWRGIRHLLSPEMLVLFQKDLDQLLAEKRINRIENIRIPKAEISDALQDRGEELITVKLVVRLNDYTIDEKSGQLLSGDPQIPIEFREYWTFPRNIGERIWVLAGISQNSIQ